MSKIFISLFSFCSILIVAFLFTQCHSHQHFGKGKTESCTTYGTVVDMSGLDGCGVLIQLSTGEKINPINANRPEYQLEAGSSILFGYRVLADQVSICMAEKYLVELTCLQKATGEDRPCIDVKNPFEFVWMDEAMDRHNPQQVVKYKVEDRFFYLFKGLPRSYLYDCQGNYICKMTDAANEPCFKEKVRDSKGKLIWEGEGIRD